MAYWTRSLASEEVASLARLETPLAAGLPLDVTLGHDEPIPVFARDDLRRTWHLKLQNRTDTPLGGVTIAGGPDSANPTRIEVGAVPPRTRVNASIPWSPARLLPGKHTFHISVVADGSPPRHVSWPVEIVAARQPADTVPIISWSGNPADDASMGMTVGGVTGQVDGPLPREVARVVRQGMYVQNRQFLSGHTSVPGEYFLDCAGNRAQPDQRAPEAFADLQAKAGTLARGLARLPDVRYTILNSEHQWIWSLDFRPETMAWVKETFGLDLAPWAGVPEDKAWATVHPFGRLARKAGIVDIPPGGIVAEDHPFYRFHRWWHSAAPGTEVFLNEYLHDRLKAEAPWVTTIVEPVLRRPAVRTFTKPDILEEWFYYASPLSAIWVQERLTTVARGVPGRPSAMPQFLLKPGMAAPYGGMPTPHMYRETMWHCIARPLDAITYWSLGKAITQARDTQTQEQIDAELGKTPTWDKVRGAIKLDGERSSLFLFIPELRDEISRFHADIVRPLGALLPRWENRSRRIAVYSSFAGQLWNNIRWPGNSPLHQVILHLGQPFDVLYDQDFEANPHLLDTYDVLAIPQSPVLYGPALAPVQAMLARGGLVLTDDLWQAEVPGVTQIPWQDAKESDPFLVKLEQELLAKYGRPDHPLFVEALQTAAEEVSSATGPTAEARKLALAAVAPEVTTTTRHVYLNTLRAGGANYVVAVNDLRIPGRHYGHFQKVREDGVAQTAHLKIAPVLGDVAYQIPAATPIDLAADRTCTLDLPPAGGAILVLLPQPIGDLDLSADLDGDDLVINAALQDVQGNPAAGLIPLELTITRPDGSRDSFSRHAVFDRGRFGARLPLPWKAPGLAVDGTWTVTVRDLAAGRQATATVEY